ncbi:DUF3054 domain-containing protein [Actinomadura macrotermitis]|uniref:DUF3054 domain-containing protein n=1 Tax=Actinomadura macrotermitis TaxID=2585200 RepID=A0A7K0BQK9_9ACTN|nr:DUF3054 domain-containing protein [Actinomadura macrotermitis]MQY03460.1 hypothetical protein [Actinomadura macrotermitis]
MRNVAVAAVVDVCCVLVFVAIGRANHEEAASLTGFATTAWPFLVGLAIGWAVTRAWRRPLALVPSGVGIWAAAVAGGMALRAVSGQGIAFAFVIVACLFLALVLLGWRLVTRLVGARLSAQKAG